MPLKKSTTQVGKVAEALTSDASVTANEAGSGDEAVRATEAVPVLVGQQHGATIGSASRDQHHVVSGHVEVALQVMVDVPVDRREGARPQYISKMTDRQVVCLFVIQSSFRIHFELPLSQAPTGGVDV